MSPRRGRGLMLTSAAGLLALACLSCVDRNPTGSTPIGLHEPPGGGARFVATMICAVDVQAQETTCKQADAQAAEWGGPALNIISDAQAMVQIASVPNAYTPADSTFRLNLRLMNMSGTTLGTRDGSTVTGIKAFIPVNVIGYAGRPPGDTSDPFAFLIPPIKSINNLVQARNPDGRQSFTGADQPYWTYIEKLGPWETSQWREWQFTLHPSVSYFYFAVSVFAAVPGEAEVPASIPRDWTTPARYYDDQYLLPCAIAGQTVCVYDAVRIRFHRWASQEERQAAVELIAGVVEGGREALGEYFVRIQGDTAFVALIRAMDKLRSLPQVARALPWGPLPMESYYLRPNDGSNWNQWQIRDSSATGRKWALEAISAPLAWGCDTGAVGNAVAVVDSDFHLVADVQPNLVAADTLIGKLTGAAHVTDHGTQVFAIVAAAGNNGTGMTGTMWRPSVRAYEIAIEKGGHIWQDGSGLPIQTSEEALSDVVQAVRDGATVVNLSFGLSWQTWAVAHSFISPGGHYDPGAQTNPAKVAAQDSALTQMSSDMSWVLETLRGESYNPLIVMGAGNDRISATWNGYARVRLELRRHLMVVGAVRRAGSGLAFSTTFSNFGDTLDIVAPGEAVWTLNRNGPLMSQGTSLAAPYVTGVAGLLLSFDPRLAQKGDSIKDLILEGAASGGRKVRNGTSSDSIAVLHAYEAVKAAARRSGAPLCGNRIWTDGSTMYAERTPDQPAEELFAASQALDVLHGGKRIFYAGTLGQRAATWTSANWTHANSSWPGLVKGSNASIRSWRGQSHDGDTVAHVSSTNPVSGQGVFVTVVLRAGTVLKNLITNQNLGPYVENMTEFCSARVQNLVTGNVEDCWGWGMSGQMDAVRVELAYSPQGDELYVFVARGVHNQTLLPEYVCEQGEDTNFATICVDMEETFATTKTDVFVIPLRNPTATRLLWSVADGNLADVQIAEGGSVLVARRETRRVHRIWKGSEIKSADPEVHTCQYEYRRLRDGAVLPSGLPATCGQMTFAGFAS